MCTVLAAYYLRHFSGDERVAEAAEAAAQADAWLQDAPLRSQEDYNARLWGLLLRGGDDAARQELRQAILRRQRADEQQDGQTRRSAFDHEQSMASTSFC